MLEGDTIVEDNILEGTPAVVSFVGKLSCKSQEVDGDEHETSIGWISGSGAV